MMPTNNMMMPHGGGGNTMEMMKSSILTMMMFKSINGDSSSSHNKSNNMFDMIYMFIITQLVEIVFKYLPAVITKVSKYTQDHFQSKVLDTLTITTSEDKKEIMSSIDIQIKITDKENDIGQAMLDLITNNKNTKHVSFKNQNFILNQKDVIEIADELFITMKECVVTEDSKVESEQMIKLFSYTKNMQELRRWLDQLAHDYTVKIKNKLGNHIYYFNQHPINAQVTMDGIKDYSKLPNTCIFTMKQFETNRKFSNLFGPEISAVKQRVEYFVKHNKWYDSKGIPYTLGLLLSGEPGAGKTSTIKCLANETKRHLININLNNDITKVQLENLFYNEMLFVLNPSSGITEKIFIPLNQRIYVLEDIDCQDKLVLSRNDDPPKGRLTQPQLNNQNNKLPPQQPQTQQKKIGISEKIDLSFLLNLLDGILEAPGRIVIMTTNHPEKLDHALIRPGRIDICAKFKKCTRETMLEMIEHFYDITLSTEDRNDIFELTDHLISPAEMSKVMFENITDYKKTLVELKKYHLKEPSITNNIVVDREDNSIIPELPGYDTMPNSFSFDNF
jgi:hypothetical protein